MTIVVRLDVMLALRKVRSKDLAAHVGITESNLSLLKSGHVRGIRFETLNRICEYLRCQPGDLLAYEPDAGSASAGGAAPESHAAMPGRRRTSRRAETTPG